MHSECLVCMCFQVPLTLILSGFSACERVDTQNIAFSTQTFCLVGGKFMQIKVGSWKILEKSSNFLPEKVYEPTLSLTFHMCTVLLLTICTIVNRGNI